MAKFRYIGQANMRYGAGLVKPGTILDFPVAPDKNWEPVREMKDRVVKPKPEAKKEKSDES
jgi:hypothetical protein